MLYFCPDWGCASRRQRQHQNTPHVRAPPAAEVPVRKQPTKIKFLNRDWCGRIIKGSAAKIRSLCVSCVFYDGYINMRGIAESPGTCERALILSSLSHMRIASIFPSSPPPVFRTFPPALPCVVPSNDFARARSAAFNIRRRSNAIFSKSSKLIAKSRRLASIWATVDVTSLRFFKILFFKIYFIKKT